MFIFLESSRPIILISYNYRKIMPSVMNDITPTPKDEKSGYSWTRQRPSITVKGHKVSFSGSSKGSVADSQDEQSSGSTSPKPWAPKSNAIVTMNGHSQWQMVDRQKEAIFVYV